QDLEPAQSTDAQAVIRGLLPLRHRTVENNCYYAALKEDSCTDDFLSVFKKRTGIITLSELHEDLIKIYETPAFRFTSYTEEGSCICYSNSADLPAKKGT
ncbi:MAG TPA: hypothetical protein PLV89_06640, partial [Treponemataceae bacterium]|nr:hypothetical protein [Treponemataceae bacterium]